MSSLKAIKRKAIQPGSYREALIALGHLQDKLDVLKVANGDTVLFRLGNHSQINGQMVKAFMEVAEQHGITDINCFLCGPEDTLESIPVGQFAEIAKMRGFCSQQEVQDAVNKEREQASGLGEHSNGNGARQAAEASSGDCTGDTEAGRFGVHSGNGASETQGVWTKTTEEVIPNAQKWGLRVPRGYNPETGARDDEGENQGQAQTQGFRSEEAQGERFLSDEEVHELLNNPPF